MRPVFVFLISCILTAGVGCVPLPPNLPPDPPVIKPPATAQASLSPSQADAFNTARHFLEAPGDLHWLDGPRPAIVEQMTYQRATTLVPTLSRGQEQYWPDETQIWFVVLAGRWESQPGGPPGAPPNVYEGCLMVLFTAGDHTLIAVGDTMCPGKG